MKMMMIEIKLFQKFKGPIDLTTEFLVTMLSPCGAISA